MLGGSAAESQMPADDGGGPGARKSAALLSGFSQYPWVHKADIAFSETIEILPQADAINNSVVSFQILPSSSPGVFYSLADYDLEIGMTRNSANSVGFMAAHMTSSLLMDQVDYSLNGVSVNSECTGNQHFNFQRQHPCVPLLGTHRGPVSGVVAHGRGRHDLTVGRSAQRCGDCGDELVAVPVRHIQHRGMREPAGKRGDW